MSTDAPAIARVVPDQASQLLNQFTVSQAAALARSGDYGSAESLLKALVQRPTAPADALDLQARICAQQGRLVEAAEWWSKVLAKDPANAACQAALARLNKMQRYPLWLQTAWPLAVGLSVVVCGLLLLSWQTRRQARDNTRLRQEMAQAVKSESQATQQQVLALLAEVRVMGAAQGNLSQGQKLLQDKFAALETIQTRLSAAETANQAAFARLAAEQTQASNQLARMRQSLESNLDRAAEARHVDSEKLLAQVAGLRPKPPEPVPAIPVLQPNPSPSILISIPRVSASRVDEALLLTFDDGLFTSGTYFKPGAKSKLAEIVKTLAATPEPLHIQVVGYADDDRAFGTWTAQWESALALDRASTVAEYLIKLGYSRPEYIQTAAGTPKHRPFPSDTPANRAKNRTVRLTISN